MPAKKKTAKVTVNSDELLDSLMGEIDNDTKVSKPAISSKDYLKSFNVRLNLLLFCT